MMQVNTNVGITLAESIVIQLEIHACHDISSYKNWHHSWCKRKLMHLVMITHSLMFFVDWTHKSGGLIVSTIDQHNTKN